MKRIIALLLALVMALGLCGCSQEAGDILLDIAIDVLEESMAADEQGGSGEISQPSQPAGDLETPQPSEPAGEPETPQLQEDGSYTTKEDVALYLHLYGHLPDNFITKKEAQNLGWSGGDLRPYAPGKCIGGDRFGNYEGLLPAKDGRSFRECDIDTLDAAKRGAKRIVYSNDGLIYYSGDHYQSFELLYGEE